MADVRKSSLFHGDVVTIGKYLADHASRSTALRFVDATEQTIDLLDRFPLIGTPAEFSNPRLANVRLYAIRGFPNHLILYEPTGDDEICIRRVVHGARDLEQAALEVTPQ